MTILYRYVVDCSAINAHSPLPILLRYKYNRNGAWVHALPHVPFLQQLTYLPLKLLCLLRIAFIDWSVWNCCTNSKINHEKTPGIPRIGDRVDPRLFSENDHHSHLQGSVRSRKPLTLPQNSIERHHGYVRPENCQVESVFQTYSVFRDLCRDVRVNPITLDQNNHYILLQGSVRSREQLTLPQNSIGRHRGDVRPENCPVETVRVNPMTLEQNDHHSHLRGTVRVNPITLEQKDHQSHLRGSVRSREPLTLPQNFIGRLRSDVRLENCLVGSVCAIRIDQFFGFFGVLAQPWKIQGIGRHRLQAEVARIAMFPFSENNFQINGIIVFSQFSDTPRVSLT
ncbi:hypothetical protein CRG98_014159 [Punica granatum]|uniref:Uncharacterized protein n=1 Tax=Punica granatum TaxID=22663 RepID=A0A2I0KB41_PUNGR|nr:hypothetical protein CRG98_014159 [Punica granatum]